MCIYTSIVHNKYLFFQHIKSVEMNIQFTLVNISYNKLSISVVTIGTDSTLPATVFQKDTHTDQYLNVQSNHPLHQKRMAVNNPISQS